MDTEILYRESITPWPVLVSFAIICGSIVSAFVFIKGITGLTIVIIVAALFVVLLVVLLYWRYTIQIYENEIEFGYQFTGKEKVHFDLVDYVEILNIDRKKSTIRTIIRKFGPPVYIEGYWLPGSLIRLRLKKEYISKYKFNRNNHVKQLILVSRKPDVILQIFIERRISVQPRGSL